jgi:hypothetical protein
VVHIDGGWIQLDTGSDLEAESKVWEGNRQVTWLRPCRRNLSKAVKEHLRSSLRCTCFRSPLESGCAHGLPSAGTDGSLARVAFQPGR